MANLGDTIVNGALRVNGSIYSKDATIAYGTCDTAAATAAKVITINDPSWVLKTGNIIMVKFSATNSASNVTLNVNGTGAKQIAYSNTRPYTGNSNMIAGYANRSLVYMYDGTYWVWISSGYDANDNVIPAAISWTTAATAAKTASHNYYTAMAGYNLVTFQYANTAASALTLNINGKGAKPIYINGSASSTSNYTLPAGCYLVYYDGTNYYFRTDGKISGLGSAAYKGVDTSMTKTSTSTNVPTTKAVADLISTEIGKVSGGGGDGSSLPVGAGCDYFGTTPPEGFLFADGSAVSRTEYAELFAVIGTTYGAGDGSTTFNLPDKREAVTIMKGTTYTTLGQSVGANSKAITKENIPNYTLYSASHTHTFTGTAASHKHSMTGYSYGSNHGSNPSACGTGTKQTVPTNSVSLTPKGTNSNTTITVTSGGSGTAFNVMQKTLVCNYIIKAVNTVVSGNVTDYINEALEGEY